MGSSSTGEGWQSAAESPSIPLYANKPASLATAMAIALLLALFALLVSSANQEKAWGQTSAAAENVALAKSSSSSKAHWYAKKGKVYCKVDGDLLKDGLFTIDGKKYLFSKKGVQLNGWQKRGKDFYYFKPDIKSKGYMVTDKVVNGVRLAYNGKATLNSTTKKEVKVLVAAQKFLEKYTNPTWSKIRKLKKAFRVLVYDYNERLWHKFSAASGWARREASDLFFKKSGPCYAYGAGLAYIASAIGYKDCKAVSSGGHGWTLINNKIYDAEWTKHQEIWLFAIPLDRSGKGGVQAYKSAGIYKVTISPRTKEIGSSTKSQAKPTKGLIEKDGKFYLYKKGKKVRNKWSTVNGSKYYFTSSGAAVTGLKKIHSSKYYFSKSGKMASSKWVKKGKSSYYFKSNGKAAKNAVLKLKSPKGKSHWYVFKPSGKLWKSNKTHYVKINGKVHQVSKSGKAKSGWNKSHTRFYNEKGVMLKGVNVVGKGMRAKLYAFNSKGLYRPAFTKKLRAASNMKKNCAKLKSLLGKPKSEFYASTCTSLYNMGMGDGSKDGILTYRNFTIYTFKGINGIEYLMGIEAN